MRMQKRNFFILTAIVLYCQAHTSFGEIRWCVNGNFENSDLDLTRYNDEELSCMRCAKEEKIINLNEISEYECCDGEVKLIGLCSNEGRLHACDTEAKCDNKRQCYDGWDEMGCFGCPNLTFSCLDEIEGYQCISMEKVCDSVKDCGDGKDETLCYYFGGRCDGFLCGGKHSKCIGYDKVCDEIKDCLDGSDESNCQYCPNQFRCRTNFREDINASSAECIGRFRVCDGKNDCQNGEDESECFRWKEWSAWSECGEETESCTRIKRRSCVNDESVIVSSSLCTKDANEINDNYVGICPECLDIHNETQMSTRFTTLANETTETTKIHNMSSEGRSSVLYFDTGALTGVVVAGSLVFIAILVSSGILILKCLGRTGFWRPSSKLSRPKGSDIPGVANSNSNKVSPQDVENPYANVNVKVGRPKTPV